MSSKIRRPGEQEEFPGLAWKGWNTDLIDRGPVTVSQPVQSEPDLAEQLKLQLREEADAAFKRGHREGESAARASCRREVEEASRQMALAVHNALGEKARLRTEAEVDVVRLSLAIARKILHREVRIDPGVALGLVKAAMETVGSREIQVIRTTPALAAALRNGLAATGVPEGVTVASLEAQFEEISRGLLQAAGEAGRRG
jgi:flagellar assembly protein FliH